MIILDKFEGHIMLYCKGHYSNENVEFIDGLRSIWIVRCGLRLEHIDNSIDEYIANFLYKLLKKTNPSKIDYLFEMMHREFGRFSSMNHDKMTTLEGMILFYRTHLWDVSITAPKINSNGEPCNGLIHLIKLPKPQKKLFNRIVLGDIKDGDYKLVSG